MAHGGDASPHTTPHPDRPHPNPMLIKLNIIFMLQYSVLLYGTTNSLRKGIDSVPRVKSVSKDCDTTSAKLSLLSIKVGRMTISIISLSFGS